MRRRPLFMPLVVPLLAGLVLGGLVIWVFKEANTSTVILIRHAETEAGQGADPGLSPAGQARARDLARLLGDAGLGAVIVSDTRRSRETASPLAATGGLRVIELPARDIDAIVAAVHARDGRPVLVIGHSNTVPELVRRLGGGPVPIADSDYSGIYLVSDSPLARARLVVLRY